MPALGAARERGRQAAGARRGSSRAPQRGRRRSALNDAIQLTVPYARPYQTVVRLVVGGLAARLDLSLESLEDLQLALETLLANTAYSAGSEVTVDIRLCGDSVEVRVGPLDGGALRRELEREPSAGDGIGLRRLFETVVETAELEQREGADWLRLEKRIAPERLA